MGMNSSIHLTVVTTLVVATVGFSLSAAADDPGKADGRAALIEALEGDQKSFAEFEKVVKKAHLCGAPTLCLAEAELIYCAKYDLTYPLARILTDLERLSRNWKEEDSIFDEASETIGFIHFGRALLAASAGDDTTFESEMKEAFWLHPVAASLFAEKLSSLREKQRLEKLTVPLDVVLQTSGGKQTTLGGLAKGQKALLLDFWASWCSPCLSLMGELNERGKKLASADVSVVGINTESSREKAEHVRKEKRMSIPWLVEPDDSPYTKLLKIDSIPRAVLISADGKVLFNGHPSDPALLAALSKLGSTATK